MHVRLLAVFSIVAVVNGANSRHSLRKSAETANNQLQPAKLFSSDQADVLSLVDTTGLGARKLPVSTNTAAPVKEHADSRNDSWGLGIGLLALCIGLPVLAVGSAVVTAGPEGEQPRPSLLSRLCPCLVPAEEGSQLGIQRYLRRGPASGSSDGLGGGHGASSRNVMLNPLQASKAAHADSAAEASKRSPAKKTGPLTGKEWLEKRKAEKEAAAKAAAALHQATSPDGRRRSRGASMAGSHELGREQSNMQLLFARTTASGAGTEYVPPAIVAPQAGDDKGQGGKRVIGGKDVHGELTSHRDKTLFVEVREVLTNHGVDVEGIESSVAKVVDALPKVTQGMTSLVASAQGHKGPVASEGAGNTLPIGGVSDGELRIVARAYAGADALGVKKDGASHGVPPRPPPPTRASRVAAAASPRVGPPPVARERAQSNGRIMFSPHSASTAAAKGDRPGAQGETRTKETETSSASSAASSAVVAPVAGSTTPSASAVSSSRAGRVSAQSAESAADASASGPTPVPAQGSQGSGLLQPSSLPSLPPPPLAGARTSSASGTTVLASTATPPASRKGSVDSSVLPSTPKQIPPAPPTGGVVAGLTSTLAQLQAAAAGTRASLMPPPALPPPASTPSVGAMLPPPPATPERRSSVSMPPVALPPTTPGRASLDRGALAAALGMPLRSATPTKPTLTSTGSTGPTPVSGSGSVGGGGSTVSILPGGLPLPGPPTTLPPPPLQAPLPPPPAL